VPLSLVVEGAPDHARDAADPSDKPPDGNRASRGSSGPSDSAAPELGSQYAARGRVNGTSLPSVSVSVSVHPGTSSLPMWPPLLYPHDREYRTGRERVGMDLEKRMRIQEKSPPADAAHFRAIRGAISSKRFLSFVELRGPSLLLFTPYRRATLF
jgi:hypothetical protein